MSGKKKYIVEAGDDIQLITLTGVKDGSAITMTGVIETLETAEKLEEEAYKRGLNDAWDAARKLFSSMAESDIEKAFPIEWNNGGFKALINLQPQEAIEKLKAYEEKKKADGDIKVGDEVKQVTDSGRPTGHVCVVTRISEDSMSGISSEGYTVFCNSRVSRYWKKTVRHFDIKAILEGMQE